MTDKLNLNSIIKIFLTIILGTIAFGLLFNTFNGGENSMGEDHAGNMVGIGFNFDALLATLLILFVKILMFVLFIAIIIGLVMWIKESFLKNYDYKNNPYYKSLTKDPMIKAFLTVFLSLIGFILVISLFQSVINPGMGYGTSMNFDFSVGIKGILTLLTQLLTFVFVISIIIALGSYVKKQYDLSISMKHEKNNHSESNTTETNSNL